MNQTNIPQLRPNFTDKEKRALLALWAVPGVGPRTLDTIRGLCDGNVGALLEVKPSEWFNAPGIKPDIREQLLHTRSLEHIAGAIEGRVARGGMRVAWQSDPEYPEKLLDVGDAPPLLFYRGSVGPPRKRLAMVGSRHVEPEFLRFAQSFASDLARRRVGIVSGGAIGIDRACHGGALEAHGETWAFFGSALDVLDAAQQNLAPRILDGGGVLFSEFPPGVRASTATFPRRNRLISGASDAVLVLRAGNPSGALHTARSAIEQQRPLLACPADPMNAAAVGTNEMIHKGWARSVYTVDHVLAALGFEAATASNEQAPEAMPEQAAPPASMQASLDDLSEPARSTYLALPRAPRTFEEVLDGTALDAAALTSALCELELFGFVVQRPGKVYEKL